MSSYSEGQSHQLMDALEANGFTPGHVTKLGQFKRLGDIRLVLDGLAEIVRVTVKEETPLDTIIRVDRSIQPVYPDFVEKVMNPELERTGPDQYDLATSVSLWLYDGQEGGAVVGQDIYDYLNERDMLTSCLSLQDAVDIQKKGVAVFRKVFGTSKVYFWKSVVRRRGGYGLRVPCLGVCGGKVEQNWDWLGCEWTSTRPAVRFVTN